jgi:probable Rubsico expression protein CbbX
MDSAADSSGQEPGTLDLDALYQASNIDDALATLDRELVGLAPVKNRVKEIAALLLVEKLRNQVGLQASPPSLHMSFTGNPGTGKTTVALRMADILKKLGYVRKGHLVACTRDDLVGEFIGHTAPKTREMIKKAMGGVLFVDEAYFLHRPENERDYGREAIEILLQAMEDHRDDFVVILAGYEKEMTQFFGANPGMASRVAHHIDFPDYNDEELLQIADRMLAAMQYRLSEEARGVLRDYIALRRGQANFSNARSIRNALDRARLRQAKRLFDQRERQLTPEALATIEAADLAASRVFSKPVDPRT